MKTAILSVVSLLSILLLSSCDQFSGVPHSSSGVSKASVIIPTGSDGLTIEQRNVRSRLELDNKLGATKHLYIINPQGKCLFYDTVRGKVTSSGKRLTPSSVMNGDRTMGVQDGVHVGIGGSKYITSEVLQDDGSYGSSSEYIYWWNTGGNYRQFQVGGMNSVLITEVPVRFTEVEVDLSVAPATK